MDQSICLRGFGNKTIWKSTKLVPHLLFKKFTKLLRLTNRSMKKNTYLKYLGFSEYIINT